MTQAKLIQYSLVGIPLGVVVFGVLALCYTVYAPKGEARDGGRDVDFLRAEVNEAELRGWVGVLAEKIGPRPAQEAAKLRSAAKWIESELSAANMGYRAVTVHEYEAEGATYRNVEVVVPGGDRAAEIVVVGAHYDSVPGCPAANDNGTGVAAMLSLARSISSVRKTPERLRFVAFANEEPPHFQSSYDGERGLCESL